MSKSILKIHHEVLDTNRQQLLERLLPYVNGFILGGGFDFDFFSSSPLRKNLLEKLSHNHEFRSCHSGKRSASRIRSWSSQDDNGFWTRNVRRSKPERREVRNLEQCNDWLVYFDDLLDFQIIPAGKPVPKPEEVKSFLENLVKNYV